MTTVRRTTSEDADFGTLVKLLDEELHGTYGSLQAIYDKHNVIHSIDTVVVVSADDKPAGCGCFRRFDDTSVEIKRMFVKPEHRGRGISKEILAELERWAIELCYTRAVLETGNKQLAAIELYQRRGYERIPNYGEYAGIKTSICFEKHLASPDSPTTGGAVGRTRNRGRSVAAIVVAFFANAALSLITDQLLRSVGVYPPWGQPMFDVGLNVLALSYRLVYAILAGYIAARMAPRNPVRHAVILGMIGLVPSLAGVIVTISTKDLGPLWYPVALLISAVPCTWAGGLIAARGSRS